MEETNSVLEVSGLCFRYEADQNILDEIHFTVQQGESVGVIGANGAGKSTLLRLFVGLNEGYEGQIRAFHIPIEKKHYADIRARIGYVFQDSDSQLFMSTAYEEIAFGPRNYHFTKEEVDARVADALRMTGAEHLKYKQIYKMSGGEKKLISIATVLAMKPELILMDEPTIALDPQNRRQLIHILTGLPATKIIASHDLDMILDTCERTIVLSQGKVVADGRSEEILRNKNLLENHGLELPLCLQKR